MEYEKTDHGGKIIKWHVDEHSGVAKKVHIANKMEKTKLYIIIILLGRVSWSAEAQTTHYK
jgi:hypothetical protein